MAGIKSYYGEAPGWLEEACSTPACRGYDTELFFPRTESSWMVRRAKDVCARCPLLDPCLEWAMRQPVGKLDGIWGGTTPRERLKLRRETSDR
ncbi:WhiB family transcriptional regulator [Micromonospora sp. NPDC051141]|uniref:WhiB family transcriptional regulator n=1 Tax=Micromonospora sp. NPDC051141 TaxID=3364284 RepID=UPI00378FA65B